MIQTTTPPKKLIAVPQTESHENPETKDLEGPSAITLANILNYSRNIELMSSNLVSEIALIKS
jgi:hypothetical protein